MEGLENMSAESDIIDTDLAVGSQMLIFTGFA